jgi:hypothetical protein
VKGVLWGPQTMVAGAALRAGKLGYESEEAGVWLGVDGDGVAKLAIGDADGYIRVERGVVTMRNARLTGAGGALMSFAPEAFDAVLNQDGGGVFTDHTAEAQSRGGVAFDLLADDSDFLYLGHRETFDGAYFRLATVLSGSDLALLWEYWDGSQWTPLTVVDGTDKLTLYHGAVTWTAPQDWAQRDVNGDTLYWVRLSIAYSALQNRPKAYIVSPGNGERFFVYAQAGDTVPALVVRADGNIGVFEPQPVWALQVNGDMGNNSDIRFGQRLGGTWEVATGNNDGLRVNSSDRLVHLTVDNLNVLTVDHLVNGVGIGKTPTAKLSMALATADLDVVDAGSAAATEEAWIEVKVNGVAGYLRVYAAK